MKKKNEKGHGEKPIPAMEGRDGRETPNEWSTKEQVLRQNHGREGTHSLHGTTKQQHLMGGRGSVKDLSSKAVWIKEGKRNWLARDARRREGLGLLAHTKTERRDHRRGMGTGR